MKVKKGDQAHARVMFTAIFVAVILLRLFLTGDRDILALNAPYDEYWFINNALHWIYGGSYNHMVFAQLPIYSFWLKQVSLFGIPVRLAIDVAWIFSSAYLGFAVARLCKQHWPGVMLFLFLSFHPYSIQLFDHSLSETWLAVLMTLTLAGFIELWNQHENNSGTSGYRIFVAVISSLAFALAYHCRKEGVVMLPPIMLLAIMSYWHRATWWKGGQRYSLGVPLMIAPAVAAIALLPLGILLLPFIAVLAIWSYFRKEKWWREERSYSLGFVMIIFPLVTTIAVGVLLAGANYLKWGVFARYELAAPNYVRAVNDLNAIDLGTSTPRHITVTAQIRAKAYEVSPTFSELKPIFEGPIGQAMAKQTEIYYPVKGEIANGWFYWALRDGAAIAGWHVTAVTAERKYKAMADELEAAFTDGRLRKRQVLISMVDPDWQKWLPFVPRGIISEIQLLVDPVIGGSQFNNSVEDAKPNQFDDFTTITGRRKLPQRAFLAGWLILPAGSSISLGADNEAYSWQSLDGAIRPDVPGARAFKLVADAGLTPTELLVRLADGSRGHILLNELKLGKVKSVDGIAGANLGVDGIASGEKNRRADALLPYADKLWTYMGWIFMASALAAVVFSPRGSEFNAAKLVMVFALTAVMARVGAMSLLDASSWNGLQTRYVFPVEPYFATLGVLGLWLVYERVFDAKKRMH